MKLPGAEHATIEEAKVRDYLLSREHPVGRAKARFFAGLGFTPATWSGLRQALLDLVHAGEAVRGRKTEFGQKYLVQGTIRGPTGRDAVVVTVWIVLSGEDRPRFVTAYPGPAL